MGARGAGGRHGDDHLPSYSYMGPFLHFRALVWAGAWLGVTLPPTEDEGRHCQYSQDERTANATRQNPRSCTIGSSDLPRCLRNGFDTLSTRWFRRINHVGRVCFPSSTRRNILGQSSLGFGIRSRSGYLSNMPSGDLGGFSRFGACLGSRGGVGNGF